MVRKLRTEGYERLILKDRKEIDLTDQAAVRHLFKAHPITHVFLAAGKVGGITANSAGQTEFLYENTMIACNVIHAAAEFGVEKLLFPGSSCVYPRLSAQPIREESLLSGLPEPTNEGSTVAKVVGIKLCEMIHRHYGKPFISAVLANLYGPGDNFHPTHSHFLPGLMRRIHKAKLQNSPRVIVWGTGSPRRELMFVEDAADALYFVMQNYASPDLLNIGTGVDLSIAEIATLLKEVIGFTGELEFDSSKPDGAPQRLLDASRMTEMGWRPRFALLDGLRMTYQWALSNQIF